MYVVVQKIVLAVDLNGTHGSENFHENKIDSFIGSMFLSCNVHTVSSKNVNGKLKN